MTPDSRLRDWRDTDVAELKWFFAVLIYMSLDYRSRLDEYRHSGNAGISQYHES